VKPKTLEERIRRAVEDYQCDLLFVHRDADAEAPEDRREEIRQAVNQAAIDPPAVCVVPVRMTESWLILDEDAIRSASGNPRGRQPLNLPPGTGVERIADPKEVLFTALRTASEHTGRKLSRLRVDQRRHRVAEIMSYTQLRLLPAFQLLEDDLKAILDAQGWS
jgi:hypothetical protein